MASTVVHIEKKRLDDPAHRATLEQLLRTRLGEPLTAGDVAALSGLPLQAAEAELQILAFEYPSTLLVRDDGTLEYRFEGVERPRGASSSAFDRAMAILRSGFAQTVVVVTMILSVPIFLCIAANTAALMEVGALWEEAADLELVSVMVFVLIHVPGFLIVLTAGTFGVVEFSIGLIVLFPVFLLLGGLALLWAVFDPNEDSLVTVLVMGILLTAGGGFGVYLVWKKRSVVTKSKSWIFRFWRLLAGFVFGPAPRLHDPLADERLVTALIRDEGGVITATDLVRLFGWSFHEAEQELTRIIVDYGGDILVDHAGTMVYRFPELRRADPERAASDEEAPRDSEGRLDVAAIRQAYKEKKTKETESNEAREGGGGPPRALARLGDEPPLFATPSYFTLLALAAIVPPLLGLALHPELVLFPSGADFVAIATTYHEGMFALFVLEGVGAYPYVPFVIIPLLRVPFWRSARRRHAREKARLELIERAVEQPEGIVMAEVDEALVAKLEGDVREKEAEGFRVSFPRMTRELAAATVARISAGSLADPLSSDRG